jgi:tRNA U34 5-methylaminomethyl-2-thiouridine-forming methyltransferase MnmC
MDFDGGFELVTLKSGLKSLRCLKRRETFHPVTGPWAEARHLHVEQQRLVERASAVPRFVVWDVGFGAAANALAAIHALAAVTGTEIEVHSFDRTLAPARFALANAEELGYLRGYETALGELLDSGASRIGEHLRWRLHLGDFGDLLRADVARGAGRELPAPHAILYDPYSPATNPEMWTLAHFALLFSRLDPSAPCLWTNYTRSSAVRVALLLAGFHVGAGWDIGGKSETTIASNLAELIAQPLGERWLERVRKSYGSAPLREAVYSQTPISEADLSDVRSLLRPGTPGSA